MKIHSKKEQYIHFVDSINNLNNAWRILQDIRQCKSSPLVIPAFRFALIEYSKPYRTSRGTEDWHKIDDSHISEEHLALHKRILAARDEVHAHSDLKVREAKVSVANIASGRYASIVQNIIHGAEELPNIDSIIELIEQTLVNMYEEAKKLEAALPLTPDS